MGVSRKKVCWARSGGQLTLHPLGHPANKGTLEERPEAPLPHLPWGLSVSPQAALRLSGEATGASSTQEVPPQALREQVRAGGQLSGALFGKSLRMFAREQGALWLLTAQSSGWPLLGNCSPAGRRQEGATSPRAQSASPSQGSVWCLCRNSFTAPGPSLSAVLRGQAVGLLQAGVVPWGLAHAQAPESRLRESGGEGSCGPRTRRPQSSHWVWQRPEVDQPVWEVSQHGVRGGQNQSAASFTGCRGGGGPGLWGGCGAMLGGTSPPWRRKRARPGPGTTNHSLPRVKCHH